MESHRFLMLIGVDRATLQRRHYNIEQFGGWFRYGLLDARSEPRKCVATHNVWLSIAIKDPTKSVTLRVARWFLESVR